MPRFIILELDVVFIRFGKVKMFEIVFGRRKRGAAIVIAGSDKNFHEGIDNEYMAEPLKKTWLSE
jgi:hypothetical protein